METQFHWPAKAKFIENSVALNTYIVEWIIRNSFWNSKI